VRRRGRVREAVRAGVSGLGISEMRLSVKTPAHVEPAGVKGVAGAGQTLESDGGSEIDPGEVEAGVDQAGEVIGRWRSRSARFRGLDRCRIPSPAAAPA
jgi:enoyl reductase-like protein